MISCIVVGNGRIRLSISNTTIQTHSGRMKEFLNKMMKFNKISNQTITKKKKENSLKHSLFAIYIQSNNKFMHDFLFIFFLLFPHFI